MNIASESEGWEQFYTVTINRPTGKTDIFSPLVGHKAVEVVHLCITLDDPHAEIIVTPIKPPVPQTH